MLAKTLANFYFLLCTLFLFTGCNEEKETDHVIQFYELNADALPSFVPPFPPKKYLIKSIIYGKITIELKERKDKTLLFNGGNFHDFQLWVLEDDTVSRHFHYGTSVMHFPKDKSEGILIPLSFEKGEKKTLYYSIHDLGYAYNDSFSLKDPNEVKHLLVYEKNVKIICRSIIGIFLFIGMVFGIYLRKKIFFYYVFCTTAGLFFIEAEYGFILNIIPSSVNSKNVQLIFIQFYHYYFFFFYYALIFNSKGINKRIIQVMHALLVIIFISLFLLIVFPQELLILNNSNIIIGFTSFNIAYLFTCYLVFKGYQLKKPITNAIIFIFVVNIAVMMYFSGLANMGLAQKLEASRTAFYYLFAFDSTYYIFIILYKYHQIMNERKILLMQYNNFQRDYSLALMKGKENEKNRIGRELHDHIGGNLALMDKMGEIANLDKEAIINETIHSLDEITKRLSPKFDQQKSLEEEIELLVFQYQSSSFKIHCSFEEIPKALLPVLQNQFIRITQELLVNALKHSQAKNIHLNYIYSPSRKHLNLYYMDDGIGFPSNLNNKGIGIDNMKHRIEKLQGQMIIENSMKGSKISFINAKTDALNSPTEL
ncbi:hypothetical protein [Flammeovirga sp. SJP92]|uniref:sensor histidine kinase n=1 Tax=Flammeovirga sp. SJP92 TaxID=1775430 RepID=UPI0007879C58|nr:hypothetical protein [Flammeovirga sp. SJP92]KXX66576.1 hypothetical protein AVL50_31260 [Flammeovirga sp. SJP92]